MHDGFTGHRSYTKLAEVAAVRVAEIKWPGKTGEGKMMKTLSGLYVITVIVAFVVFTAWYHEKTGVWPVGPCSWQESGCMEVR